MVDRPARSFTSQAADTPPTKSNHLRQLRARASTDDTMRASTKYTLVRVHAPTKDTLVRVHAPTDDTLVRARAPTDDTLVFSIYLACRPRLSVFINHV